MARRVYREHSLQIAVARMLGIILDDERTWWTAIDHGVGWLGPKEAGIRKARGVKRGIPDFIVVWLDRLIGIELKAKGGRSTPEQIEVAATWSRLNHHVFVARSMEEVQSILIDCHVPLRTRMNFFSNSGGGYERFGRPAPPRHRSARRRRKSKGYLPVVLGGPTQEN